MVRRNMKIAERAARLKAEGHNLAAVKGRAIGHETRVEGELGYLRSGALGSVTTTEKMDAEGKVMPGLHGGNGSERVRRGHKYADGPQYAWLEAGQAGPASGQDWSKSEVAPSPCACESPMSVMDVDVDLPDESAAEVVIVGGGPHALAALAALNEGSLEKDSTGTRSLLRPPCRVPSHFTSHESAVSPYLIGVGVPCRSLRDRPRRALHAFVERSLWRP
jgi:hypothetical protein